MHIYIYIRIYKYNHIYFIRLTFIIIIIITPPLPITTPSRHTIRGFRSDRIVGARENAEFSIAVTHKRRRVAITPKRELGGGGGKKNKNRRAGKLIDPAVRPRDDLLPGTCRIVSDAYD